MSITRLHERFRRIERAYMEALAGHPPVDDRARWRPMGRPEMKPRLYVNPNAPQDLKDTFAEVFPDVERAAPELIEQLVGGFTDDGPPVSAYAAALVDETGKLTLIAGPENIPGFDSV